MAEIDVSTLPRTKAEAIAIGSRHYFTGEPCKNGHVAPRYFKGACIACKRDISSTWRNNNIDKSRECVKRSSNTAIGREKGRKRVARWHAADPKRAWAIASISAAKRRAAEKGIDFALDYRFILSIAPETCPATGRRLVYEGHGTSGPTPNSPTIDRLDSSRGYVPGNVAVISHIANRLKSNATLEEIKRLAAWLEDALEEKTDQH